MTSVNFDLKFRQEGINRIMSNMDKLNAKLQKLNIITEKNAKAAISASSIQQESINMEQKMVRLQEKAVQASIKVQKGNLRAIEAPLKARRLAFKKLNKVILSAGLAMLFFGMAIKRFAQQAIRSLINTWAEAMEGTTQYNETVGRLNASFQFLKFAIADAFLSSAFGQMLIQGLINIIDYISSLSPATLKWIGIILLVVFIFGALLFIVGIFTLAILGASVAALELGLAFSPIIIAVILIAAIIAFGIIAIVLIWGSHMTKTQKIILTIIVVLIVILTIIWGIAIAVGAAGFPFLLIGVIIIGLIALIIIFWDKFLLLGLKALKFILDAILTSILWPLKAALMIYNKIKGTNIKLDLGGKLFDKKIAEVQARIDAKAKAKTEAGAGTKEGGILSGIKEKIGGTVSQIKEGKSQTDIQNQTTNIGEVNLTVEGAGETDPDALADKIKESMSMDLSRQGAGGGI